MNTLEEMIQEMESAIAEAIKETKEKYYAAILYALLREDEG